MNANYKGIKGLCYNLKTNSENALKSFDFWVTVCKTVRPMLSDHCLSVLSVCSVSDVGVL